jgi:hypothetical protein
MRTIKAIGFHLVFAVLLTSAHGTSVKAQSYTALGAGASASCGTWLANRKNNNFYFMGNWALGFITGAEWHGEEDVLRGIDADGVAYWLDNYCEPRPTDKFSDAVVAFIQDRIAKLKK